MKVSLVNDGPFTIMLEPVQPKPRRANIRGAMRVYVACT